MKSLSRHNTVRGFTLIEVVLVVIIAGILATVALRSVALVSDAARTEETKQELDRLAEAMVGRAELHSAGVRSDYGYVGDVGALPPNLDALVTNPGLATWHGPYVSNRFEQSGADFKTDAWGAPYSFSGVDIRSTGSGQSIVRKVAGSIDELLRNRVMGNVYDADGTAPGNDYRDSVRIILTIPNGSGGVNVRSVLTDAGGYFVFDSIPIGKHDLNVIYLPDADTLHRFVSVNPDAAVYGEYFLTENLWAGNLGGIGTGIEFVENSDSLYSSHCNELLFRVVNTTAATITISSLTLSWSSPTAYFGEISWNGIVVFSGGPVGSGTTAPFSAPQSIDSGESVQVQINDFRAHAGGGGAQVNMTGATFAVEFSDGSVTTVYAGDCYW